MSESARYVEHSPTHFPSLFNFLLLLRTFRNSQMKTILHKGSAVLLTYIVRSTETSIHSIPPHLVEQEHSLVEPANFVSEDIDSEFLGDSKSLVPETSSLRGEPWIVKKFGGTSVGRFGVKIAEDIVS